MGIRKNYRSLTSTERTRFVQALFHVKSTGVVDELAEIHASHFDHNIHRSSHFLPWHRELLVRFEAALQEHHPDVTIPYWDSTVDRSPADPLWDFGFLGQFDDEWDLGRALGSFTLPTVQQVQTNRGRTSYDPFWRELESVIHNPPHVWVGGVMAGVASPGDPVFYLHHCWIDLLWTLWQHGHPDAPFVASGPGVDVDDPLNEWPDRTPSDVLEHLALGYSYDVGPVFETEGRLSFLRTHNVGTKFGPPLDQMDVEVVVRLVNRPDRAFGFQLRADSNEAARAGMLDTLRTAFNDDQPVRLDYRRTGLKNGVLIRVAALP
jgi:tyrosinase